MTIRKVSVRKILNSRGEATLEVELQNKAGAIFRAQIPSGKSTGENEALVLPYEKARNVVQKFIAPSLRRKAFRGVESLDRYLIRLDGTERKTRLGGNLILGISIAFSRLLAAKQGVELWDLWNKEFFAGYRSAPRPLIFSNLINGGAHAGNNLDIQEYLVVSRSKGSIVSSIEKIGVIYKKLGEILEHKFKTLIPIGDEGGYAVDFPDNFDPLRLLDRVIKSLRLEKDFFLGIDVAANTFFNRKRYLFGRKSLQASDLLRLYVREAKSLQSLLSFEDPFSESDRESFAMISRALKDRWVVGDDLTATNPFLIKQAAAKKLVNAVIIKANQIGTITETCEAMRIARANGVKRIISHRSGETEDIFLAHLARAGGVEGVKIGAPIHERISKFNELARLYD